MNQFNTSDSSNLPSNNDESIERKIQKLEEQLKTLRISRDLQSGVKRYVGAQKWKASIFTILLLVLSGIPPALVVLDRWFMFDPISNYPRDTWCKIDFLCRTGQPGYFVWVIICMVLVLILMSVFYKIFQGEINPIFQTGEIQPYDGTLEQTRYRKWLFVFALVAFVLEIAGAVLFNRIPGAELLLIVIVYVVGLRMGEEKFVFQPNLWKKQWEEKAPLYATVIFSQVALILFMREVVTIHVFQWIYVFLLALAAIPVIWQRKKLGKIYWIFTLAIILFTFQMGSWKFAKVGDEYGAFYYSPLVIAKQSIFQMIDSFFSLKAAYDILSYFSLLLQFITMALVGFDFFGWHLSSILLVILTIPIYYSFLKSFVSDRVAFFAVVFLSFSHYLINFSRDGIPYLDSIFPIGLILWTAGWALKKRNLSAYFLVGVSMGSCFYFYPTALYVIPLPLFLIIMFDPPFFWAVWKRYFFILVGILALMTPIFFQPYYWGNMLLGTAYVTPSFLSTLDHLAFKLGSNFLYTFFDYFYLTQESHFVTASHLDPLTAVFVFPGLVLACLNLRRNRFMIFLVVAYFFEVFMMCTSQYEIPPNTRLFMLLPLLVVWAAIGMDWLVRVLSGITNNPNRFYRYVTAGILVSSCCLNLIQGNVIYPLRVEGFYPDTVVFRMIQHDEETVVGNPDAMKNYLFLTDKNSDLGWYNIYQDVFHQPESKSQMNRLVVESPEIPDYWMSRIKTENTLVVVVTNSLSPELIASLRPILAQTGRISCNVSDKPGRPLNFQVWVSQDYQNICNEAQSMD